jgi:hypothetical protein
VVSIRLVGDSYRPRRTVSRVERYGRKHSPTSRRRKPPPYAGPLFKGGPGKVPIYATDGVENNAIAQGMVVYRTNKLPRPGAKGLSTI